MNLIEPLKEVEEKYEVQKNLTENFDVIKDVVQLIKGDKSNKKLVAAQLTSKACQFLSSFSSRT
jgi:uncharacterized protein YggU (UPF0235/DUF167 family)